MGRKNFRLVQALRGIAALWVVLFHASEGRHINGLLQSFPAVRPLFDLGDNGVAIFFALSGFVIAHSMRGDVITASYVGRFALRRSIRLDPPYWVAIALFVALAFVSAKVKGEAFIGPSIGQILAHVTYTQGLLGYEQINPAFWTLTYEVQFYLALVGSTMLFQRLGKIVPVILFGAAVMWGTGALENPVRGLFLGLWHCFFIGSLAYHARSNRWALAGMFTLAIAVLGTQPTPFNISCILTGLFLWSMRKLDLMHIAPKPLLFLGAISYSLYLTHHPVSGASFFVLAKAGVPEEFALFLTIAACIAVAWFIWLAIERPSINLGHRIRLRPNSADGPDHWHAADLDRGPDGDPALEQEWHGEERRGCTDRRKPPAKD